MPQPASRTTIVFMHHLGGSAGTWKRVRDRLADRFPGFGLDLPGFGDAASENGRPVEAMAEWVEHHVADRVDGAWVLVGHSMSAKVALAVAKRAAGASSSPSRLVGLVLAAGSPPAPEPMEEEKRREMLGWFQGDDAQSRREAESYVAANVAAALEAEAHETATGDVLRASPHGWRHWLEAGSLEDLREQIGILEIPALVLAGDKDEALGEEIQRDKMVPHLANARLERVADAGHLLPLEKPDAVAELIGTFVAGLGAEQDAGRITRRTELLLAKRGASDDGYEPRVLDRNGLAALRAVVRCVLPMPDGIRIDLAAKLDSKLAEAIGDGWRFAMLPPDAEAYRQAIATLDAAAQRAHGAAFAELPPDAVERMVQQIAEGEFETGNGPLDAEAMKNWLAEVRGDICQIFITHPAVEARANILAAATGNDRELLGFARLGANESEPWENSFWQERA